VAAEPEHSRESGLWVVALQQFFVAFGVVHVLFTYRLHDGRPAHVDGHAVNTPSHVTPWLSVDEQVLPVQETEVPPEQAAVQVPNWDTVRASASGAIVSSTAGPPQPRRERPTNVAIAAREIFMRNSGWFFE
jgi:hypothetical protein